MLLDELTPSERDLLLGLGQALSLAEGDVLLEEGDTADSLFLVRSGTVAAVKRIDAGNTKELRAFGPGEWVGEMAFLGSGERSADVVAHSTAEIVRLPFDALNHLLAQNPELGMKLYRSLAQGLAQRLKSSTEELRRTLHYVIQELDL